MHHIQVLAGPTETIHRLAKVVGIGVVCPLEQGLSLLPITEDVEERLKQRGDGDVEPFVPHSGEFFHGVSRLASELSMNSIVLYLATYIHGGTGGQDAVVWKNGKVVLSLGDDEENMSRWPDTPISRALRHVGVTASDGQDEFDAIGLGKHRSSHGWADAHRGA